MKHPACCGDPRPCVLRAAALANNELTDDGKMVLDAAVLPSMRDPHVPVNNLVSLPYSGRPIAYEQAASQAHGQPQLQPQLRLLRLKPQQQPQHERMYDAPHDSHAAILAMSRANSANNLNRLTEFSIMAQLAQITAMGGFNN